MPCQGFRSLPLRPVWPSWMAGTAPMSLTTAATRARPSIWESSQIPAQLVPVRPSGVMAICSGKTKPKPRAARDPISMTWKSPIRPSTDRYMVIGDMAMRLRSVTPLSVKGLKRSGIGRLAWGIRGPGA